MFNIQSTLFECFQCVVFSDFICFLNNNRTSINSLINKMHRASAHFTAIIPSIAITIGSGKCR